MQYLRRANGAERFVPVHWDIKCAIAIAEKHAHATRPKVRHGQVQLAIPVEVSDGYRVPKRHNIFRDGMKRAVAIAQKDADAAHAGVVSAIHHRQVQLAVAVEIRGCYGVGATTRFDQAEDQENSMIAYSPTYARLKVSLGVPTSSVVGPLRPCAAIYEMSSSLSSTSRQHRRP